MNEQYLRSDQLLTAKVEAVPGTEETLDPAADAIKVANLRFTPNFEVDPAAAPKQLRADAKRSKKKHEVKVFADLDHLFKSEPGTSRARRYLEERPVDAAFLRALTSWAIKRVGR